MSLSVEEVDAGRAMMAQLDQVDAANKRQESYYEGPRRVRNLGAAIPPEFRKILTIVGWPGLAVDALEERVELLGWSGGEHFGLDEVWTRSQLSLEASMGHLDAFIYGTGFAAVVDDGTGPVVRAQSPKNATVLSEASGRNRVAGMIRQPLGGESDAWNVELLFPDRVVAATVKGGTWSFQDGFSHALGRVPLVQLPNRRRTARHRGMSEITRPIRTLTDEAVRALLGMGVNREFYSMPQRWMMGGESEWFENEDGSKRPGWEWLVKSVWVAPPNTDGNSPTVGQFPAASPAPYVDQVKLLSQLVAAETGLPAHYLGFVTANPASADAIRSAEARLVRRAEQRQRVFGAAWMEVARMAAEMIGEVPTNFESLVRCQWLDASTPTKAASADAAMKLVSSGILPAHSKIVLDMIGLTPEEQDQVAADRAASSDPLAELAMNIGRQSMTAVDTGIDEA